MYGGLGWFTQNHNYIDDSTYYKTTNWPWLGPITTQHTVWLNRGSAHLGAFKYFIQTQYGFKSKYFEAAFSVRFTDLYFSVVENKVVPFSANGYEEVERFCAFRNSLLFEPAVTLRAGGNNVKLQLQAPLSGFIMNDFRSETQLFSVGLFFQPKQARCWVNPFSNKLNFVLRSYYLLDKYIMLHNLKKSLAPTMAS